MHTAEMIENLCWNILCLRIIHRLSKKEMASRLGISVSSLRKLEVGGPLPRVSFEVLYRITSTFGISAETLLETRLVDIEPYL